jgi:hypothetical protein
VSNPNPFDDGYIIEPMLFNTANPQIGGLQDETLYTANWSGRFNNADIELAAGQGLAVWVNDLDADYDEQIPVTFLFPKADEEYLYYYSPSQEPTGKTTGPLERGSSHKFIYDSNVLTDLSDKDYVPLSVSGLAKENLDMVLVGNPFMAHLDVEKFAASNDPLDGDPLIATEYKLPFGVDGETGLIKEAVTFKKLHVSGVSPNEVYEWCNTSVDNQNANYRFIAPMQSFIVTPTSPASNYEFKAYFADTEVAAGTPWADGGTLRSATDNTPRNILSIIAARDEVKNKVLLLHRENASSDYQPEEDSYKLFSSDAEAVSLYMRSADGKALDINTIGSFSEIVPLCIRTSVAGEINLNFSGMKSFGRGVKIYLHDTTLNQVIDLSKESDYSFTKNADEGVYLEKRLYLSFSDFTGINNPASSLIFITQTAHAVHVFSSDNSPLESVRIFDIQGRMLSQEVKPGSSYSYTFSTPGVYLVRAVGKSGVEVKKILVK